MQVKCKNSLQPPTDQIITMQVLLLSLLDGGFFFNKIESIKLQMTVKILLLQAV